MPFTRGARVPTQTPASNSDARKRIEEAMNALRDGLRDAGANVDTSKIEAFLAAGYEANHTPPPAPCEPWSVISEDRDKPTLAKVTLSTGSVLVGEFYTNGNDVTRADTGFDVAFTYGVTDVELLHTYDQETQVPVERAPSADSVLVRELRLSLGLTCPDEYTAIALRSALTSLADGAESKPEPVEDEATEIACAWADYRKDYGVAQRDLNSAHKAFTAGWKAAREGDQSGSLR